MEPKVLRAHQLHPAVPARAVPRDILDPQAAGSIPAPVTEQPKPTEHFDPEL